MTENNLDDIFERIVRGRYPLSEGTSTARFWAPTNTTVTLENKDGTVKEDYKSPGLHVPRPDRDLLTVQLLSTFLGVFGIDHFYLRSPATGIIKLLTFGGFGLWYVWDLLQVWFESKRILSYGLTTPLDLVLGIGQGMITNVKTAYKQETSFFLWTLSTVFGFMGLDMFLLGRIWLGVRILMLFALALIPMMSVFTAIKEKGIVAGIEALRGFSGIWFLIFTFCIGSMWLSHLYTIFIDPTKIMTDGITNPKIAVTVLGWYTGLFVDKDTTKPYPESATDWKTVQEQYTVNNEWIIGDDLAKMFWIGHDEKVVVNTSTKTEGVPPWLILKRLFVVMMEALTGAFKSLMAMTPWGKAASGLGNLAGTIPGIGGLVSAAGGLPSGIGSAAAGLPGVGGLVNLTGGLPSGLGSAAGGLSSALGGQSPQIGGAYPHAEPLSTESKIIGASLIALIGGGAMKVLIDKLVAPKH